MRRPLPRRFAFAAASIALIAVFVSSGMPISIYNLYRADGVTTADLALATVIYLVVTAAALLLGGRLSNHLGRKPVAIAAVASSLIGVLVLTGVHALPVLLAGRAFQGLACGIASSAIGALVVDLAPRSRMPRLASVVTSVAPPFAVPFGSLLSGALAVYAPMPRTLGYELVAVLLLGCIVLLAFCPETVERRPGALASMRPRIHVPAGAPALMVAAGGTLVATWALSGFYQSFSPTLAADYLGGSDPLLVAVVFASSILLTPVGALLTGRMRPLVAQRAGLVVFLAATVLILVSLRLGAIAPFLLIGLVAGVGQGAANTGGMAAVIQRAAPHERADALATLYLVSYLGAAVPNFVAGRLSAFLDLPTIGIGIGALVLIAGVVALIAGARPAPEPAPATT